MARPRAPGSGLRIPVQKKQLPAIFLALACCLLLSANATGALKDFPRTAMDDTFAKLRPEQLIQKYEARGLALAGTYGAPSDEDIPSTSTPGPQFILGPIIVRRGREMVPALISFLEREAPLTRDNRVGFTCEILGMLKEIGDPRAVPTILRVLDGWEGKATSSKRYAALYALEELTHVSFHKPTQALLIGNMWQSVEHPKAVKSLQLEDASKLYHEWLANEGKDPNQWLPLAKARAQALLTGDNISSVYCAKEFLTRGYWKDK
jgi:hypothetical protein